MSATVLVPVPATSVLGQLEMSPRSIGTIVDGLWPFTRYIVHGIRRSLRGYLAIRDMRMQNIPSRARCCSARPLELTRLRGHLILEETPEKGAHVGSSVEIPG